MKRIIKSRSPKELESWKNKQQKKGLSCSYNDMPNTETEPVKNAVHNSLIKEQGGICCYTGVRINIDSSHIEHLKPQTICVGNEDVEYNNLLAAYPRPNPRVPSTLNCPFGAHKKADWFDENLLIHPLRSDCERQFTFDLEGKIAEDNEAIEKSIKKLFEDIEFLKTELRQEQGKEAKKIKKLLELKNKKLAAMKAKKEEDKAAKETVEKLGLNHEILVSMRKEAIDEFLFSEEEEISEAKAKVLLKDIMNRDNQGNFRPYCFVLFQACNIYINERKKSRVRRTSIHRQNQD